MPRIDRKRELQKDLKKDLVAYFTETTVHGFRYVVEGRNRFEQILWIIFIIGGFGYSTYRIYNSYEYWESHPVETTIDQVGVPVTELPFPTITVCDTNALQMPRKNRWMLVETLLNSLELLNPKEQVEKMNPGKYVERYFTYDKLPISITLP